MTIAPRLRTAVLAGLLAVAPAAASPVRFTGAAQPQLAVGTDGRVWLVYGHGPEIFVATSRDGGASFGATTRVATVPKLMLGLRRGPRIAVHGDEVTVTAVGDELLAFHSSNGGRSWSGPIPINDAPRSAREGLHDLAIAPDGRMFMTWLDQRNGRMELWGCDSTDAGRSWRPNALVYRSPDKSICECCHPSALFDAAGNLAVMWRNSLGGFRDLWMATRPRGGTRFGPARKLGEGTWKLDACPMDGGKIVALAGGRFGAVWQRAGDVFFTGADATEVRLGRGKQPVALDRGGHLFAVWQDGADLVRGGRDTAPVPLARNARFPVMVRFPHGPGSLVAYEQGPAKNPDVVVERF